MEKEMVKDVRQLIPVAMMDATKGQEYTVISAIRFCHSRQYLIAKLPANSMAAKQGWHNLANT
jgi:hypothetical protein